MIALLIAFVGTVALLFAAIPLYRREKDQRQRRSIIVGNLLAFLIVWGQFVQQHFDERADEGKHTELVAQNEKLIAQNESDAQSQLELIEQNKRLISQNAELDAKLAPVVEAAQAKHPGVTEAEAVEKLIAELDKLNPRLEFLPDRTSVKEDVEGGPFETTFFFRPRHPVVVRDASLDLTFDGPIRSVKLKARNTLPFTDNLQVKITSPLTVTAKANMIGEAGWLEVAVLSKQRVKILRSAVRP